MQHYIVEIVGTITMSKRNKMNTIRIIAGLWRGRRLEVLDVDGLRPTTDRVRETVFNWLMPNLAGARCLDLFAGTGALGFESLSRGASFVQCVELNKLAAKSIQKNAVDLMMESAHNQIAIEQTDALQFLTRKSPYTFDIVFLDPPFKSSVLASTIELLDQNDWLSNRALVYIEQSTKSVLPDLPSAWTIHRKAKAGQSAFYLLRTG